MTKLQEIANAPPPTLNHAPRSLEGKFNIRVNLEREDKIESMIRF